jgi:transcriptional regulator with XRE-family HTH domain
MKLNTDKIFSLINHNENSLHSFANKIGMSHVGLKRALDDSTLKIDKLILIAEHFKKPIEYFFDEREEEDNLEIGLNADAGFTKVREEMNKSKIEGLMMFDSLLLEIRECNNEIKALHKEKFEWYVKMNEYEKIIDGLKKEIRKLKRFKEEYSSLTGGAKKTDSIHNEVE